MRETSQTRRRQLQNYQELQNMAHLQSPASWEWADPG